MQSRIFAVKKIFGPTIQGEGALSGTVTHFVRFSGCNMWDGRPETKASSQCPYCDTDFFGGEKMTAEQISDALAALPPAKWVTFSGGEPALQIDAHLLSEVKSRGFSLALETNGSRDIGTLHHFFNQITCSPKVRREEMKLEWCHDLKLLYPHPFLKPEDFEDFPAKRFYLQPVEDENWKNNIDAAVARVLKSGGKWKLSMQIHKLLGVE